MLLVSPAEEKLRRGILDYLARHPRAMDSIEGIVEWWLLEQRIVDTLRDVEKVLADLVAENLIRRKGGPDGKVFYHANPPDGD